MAAVAGHFNFLNMTSKEAFNKVWFQADTAKALSAAVSVAAMLMFPIVVFGNSLVILSVWKDPLKTLRSSRSNFILLSMAVADLLVGLVVCPLAVYWVWTNIYHEGTSLTLSLLSSFLVNVSVGHIFLLSIDRFFALVTPLHYRVKVTNKRVRIATACCWIYFLLFDCALGLLQEHYITWGIFYNLQILCFLMSILVLYVVILCRFHKYSREVNDQSTANRQMIVQRERKLWKAITIIICAFLFCFMPRFITQIVIYVCLPCHRNFSVLMLFYTVVAGLTYLNSGLNPFLYAWRLPKYRDTFKYFLKKRACYCTNQNIESAENPAYADTRL
ncbi:5-hydroxytryptamine receptor 4-like [Oculina patagonica]